MKTYQEKFDQIATVLAETVKAKRLAVSSSSKPPLFLLLPLTDENKLSLIPRDELLKILETIERDGKAVELSDWNYPERIELKARRRIIGTFPISGRGTIIPTATEEKQVDRELKPPYDTKKNIAFTPCDNFENWHSAYLHQKNTDVSQLNNLNFEKVYSTVHDIDEELQMHPRPDVKIGVYFASYTTIASIIMASLDKAKEYRTDALNYLRTQNAIESYSFGYTDKIGSHIWIRVNIDVFRELRKKIREVYNDRHSKKIVPPEPETPTEPKKDARTDKPIYQIKYTGAREIVLNDFLLSQLNFDSENHVVFEYVFKRPHQEITTDEIEQNCQALKLTKPLTKIVENWGFTGQLKKAFFDVSKSKIKFRNPLYEDDLEALDILRLRFPRK